MKLNLKDWMKNKKNIFAVVLLGILVLCLMVWGMSQNSSNTETSQNEKTGQVNQNKEADENVQADKDDQSHSDEAESGNNESAENVSSGTDAGRQWVTQYEEMVKRQEQEASNESQSEQTFSYPYSIPMSTLVVENMIGYSGIYLEDGSDEEVSDVATILIENTGDQGVEYADIEMRAGSETLHFIGTAIPPKSRMIIMAKDRAPMPSEPVTQCSAAVTDGSDFSMSEDRIQVTEGEDHTVVLKNLTEEEIPMVRVFYKFYMEDQDTYVGGITYTIKAEDVEPGVEYSMIPSHYSGGGESKILMARTYVSKED